MWKWDYLFKEESYIKTAADFLLFLKFSFVKIWIFHGHESVLAFPVMCCNHHWIYSMHQKETTLQYENM